MRQHQMERGGRPEISVIVPVYNVAPYLAACMDSLLAQTFRDFEIVLIEDGSTDDSREIAEAYEAKDARVRLVEHRWNHGVTAAHNLGLEVSRGRYVAFADSDDLVTPDYLSLLHLAAEQQQADIVQGGFQQFTAEPGDGAVAAWTDVPLMLSDAILDRLHRFAPSVRLHIAPWCKLYRRSFLDEHHMVFYDMPVADDVCFHLQGLLVAERYAVLPNPLYHYRVRAGSIASVKGTKRIERYAVALARALEQFGRWMEQEPRLAGADLQRRISRVLYLFFMSWVVEQGGISLQDMYERCQQALASEPHARLFDAMLYDELRGYFPTA